MLITLNPISFTSINGVKNVSENKSLRMNQGLACDTLSFGNSEFLSKPKEEIFAQIKKSIEDEHKNLLGSGGEACVYQIDGTDYCVRIPSKLLQNDLSLRTFNLMVSEKDKINHTVAKLNDGITIMPIIKGLVFGNCDNAKLLKTMVNMPQRAYNDFLEQICHAYKYGLEFDATWKNVIIDPEKNTITAIDFYSPDGYYRKHFLNEAYHSLAGHKFASSEYKKICAGRLYLGALDLMGVDRKYTPEIAALSPDVLSNELKRDKLLENENYYKVLNDKFKVLEELKYEQLRRRNSPNVLKAVDSQIKVIRALIKQLFNVV